MEWIIVGLLIILGLVLLIAEIIFIPGTTVAGVLGALMTVAGIYLSFDFFGDSVGAIILSISVFTASISIYYSFSTKTWEKLALHDTLEKPAKEEEAEKNKIFVGNTGIAKTDLRPVGTGVFGGEFFEVTVMRGYIHAGTGIKIVKVTGNKIYVENTENSANERL
jgi:membrane-bound ClpP family serine protease